MAYNEDQESPKNTKEVMTHSWEEANSDQALWTRSKDDITKDKYQVFERYVTKQYGVDASSHIHFIAKGSINFNSILYPPSDVPSNLMYGNFGQERKGGLKLYVKKVLISGVFEPMPKYLSFVKGVVDSNEPTLKVNRQTLWEYNIIEFILKKLVRKAIEMMCKIAEKDESREQKGDVDDNKTKEADIDKNREVVETENYKLSNNIDKIDNIDRPRPYLQR